MYEWQSRGSAGWWKGGCMERHFGVTEEGIRRTRGRVGGMGMVEGQGCGREGVWRRRGGLEFESESSAGGEAGRE